MKENNGMVSFLYGTVLGRTILKIIMVLHLDKIAVCFLWTKLSKPLAKWYVKKHDIRTDKMFRTYREMFVRNRNVKSIDSDAKHLISPCDGLLSCFKIDKNCCFYIKNSIYKIKDFVQDEEIADRYNEGTCLVFRLCASDYHHYCYVDSGFQGRNNYIPGVLHSVQPIACEKYPVFILNKRCWSILQSDNFGNILQCEIGALIVGDIINEYENGFVIKGEEKGYFELAGSTIVLLFEKDIIKMRPSFEKQWQVSEEIRVRQGEWIGSAL